MKHYEALKILCFSVGMWSQSSGKKWRRDLCSRKKRPNIEIFWTTYGYRISHAKNDVSSHTSFPSWGYGKLWCMFLQVIVKCCK